MIHSRLLAHDIVSYATGSIQELRKSQAELENLRVNVIEKLGYQKLDFCLKIIEQLSSRLVGLGMASVVLSFYVSPWISLIAPITIAAFNIICYVNKNYFGRSATDGDWLQEYEKELTKGRIHGAKPVNVQETFREKFDREIADRIMGTFDLSGRRLHVILELQTKQFQILQEFFNHHKKPLFDNKVKETQPYMNTLYAITHLFICFDSLKEENLSAFKSSVDKCKLSLKDAHLASKEKEAFTILLNQMEQHPDEIKQKFAEMRKNQTLSQEALISYISELPSCSS